MLYTDDGRYCPKCGASVRRSVTAEDDDPVAQLTRTLLFQARSYQQRGDLANAIKCANDALAIRPDCSTIHAFLGSLYEQKGEMAAARRHFQKALTVPPEPSPCDLPLPGLPEAVAVRPISSGWFLPVLVGCVVFSGLAAMFTLWPGNPVVKLSGIATSMHQHQRPRLPFPDTSPVVKSADDQPAPTPEPKEPVKPTRQPEAATPIAIPKHHATTATVDNLAMEPGVIGPRATARLPVMPIRPTVEQADTAFQRQQYEQAAAIYENVLPAEERPNPRAYQHLAQCYLQLGNMKKVQDYLEKAIEEYKVAAADDPQNASIHQELKNCEVMLEQVRAGNSGTP